MRKFLKSFVYAGVGIMKAYTTERNLKIMTALSVLSIIISFALHLTLIQTCIILIANAIAHGVELVNTSIEYLCNHIHVGYHKDIEMVKDIAAGATLVISIICAFTAILIFAQALFS